MIRQTLQWAAVAAMLGIGSMAHAVTLYTAPVDAAFGGDSLYCYIRNVGTVSRSVTIDLIDFSGNSTNTLTQTLSPGAFGVLGGASGSSCKFTGGGTARTYRGMADYYHGTFDTILIPAE